jgi:predicted ABC-type ATPase
MPELYIITGSNGAGKSSVGIDYLPEYIRNNYTIFDGDKLFMQKQKELWLSGIRAHKEAKKIAYASVIETFERLVETALNNNDHFVYEGHFTNDATWDIPQRFKNNGYRIILIFLGLRNPDLSELRVIDRVKGGGHYVARIEIEDNFYGNLAKLNQHFGIIDYLKIIDTSESSHIELAIFENALVRSALPYLELPKWFITYLPALAAIIQTQQLTQ